MVEKKFSLNSIIIAQLYYLCIISKSVYEADRKQHTEDCSFVQEVQGKQVVCVWLYTYPPFFVESLSF